MKPRAVYSDTDVESMLRSMFFMAALQGSFLVSRGQWSWENRKRYEDAFVKFLMNNHKPIEK